MGSLAHSGAATFAIANLVVDCSRGSKCLVIEDCEVEQGCHEGSSESAVSIYRPRNDHTKAESITAGQRDQCRASNKARVSLDILLQIIAKEYVQNRDSPFRNICEDDVEKVTGTPLVSIGDIVMAVDEVFDGSTTRNCSRNLYLPLTFTFPIVTDDNISQTFVSTQYLQACSPTIRATHSILKTPHMHGLESVTILTGVCLYNEKILHVSLGKSNGRLDIETLLFSPATLNELESVARCSTSVADIATMLIWQNRIGTSSSTINVMLDIPSWHYYSSVIALFEKGQCSAVEALQWMDAVDLRHDQIADVFAHAVQFELCRRGGRKGEINIQVSEKCSFASKIIRNAVKCDRVPKVDDLLTGLDSYSNWKNFYGMIPDKDRPHDIHALGTLSYVFEVVKTAYRRPALSATPTLSSRSRLIVSVDDRMEHRIYLKAQNILKKLRVNLGHGDVETLLLEVYTARRLFVDNNKTKSMFFYHDQTPGILLSTSSRKDEDLKAFIASPVEVIEHLYGYECAHRLHRWSQEVGLS